MHYKTLFKNSRNTSDRNLRGHRSWNTYKQSTCKEMEFSVTSCVGLNEKCLHRFIYFHTWSPAGGAVGKLMKPLGYGALLKEIHYWMSFENL